MKKSHALQFDPAQFQSALLAWYARERRVLPWRARSGVAANPYHVWLSEIMLQQTTVPAVIPYFEKFITRWPDIHALAQAPSDNVMAAWAGLGYYARARNLLACAQVISHDYAGTFPCDEAVLMTLPGIGPYTAAAISSIAFGKKAVVVDGNVERVAARIFAFGDALPAAKPALKLLAGQFYEGAMSAAACADLPQALMDLGSGVCTPKSPRCAACPVKGLCRAYALDEPASYPVKKLKDKIETRTGRVYLLTDTHGMLLVERRSPDRMLGGMVGFPTTDWDRAGDEVAWDEISDNLVHCGQVNHVFSHFSLKLDVYKGRVDKRRLPRAKSYMFICLNHAKMNTIGLPSLFKKVASFLTVAASIT